MHTPTAEPKRLQRGLGVRVTGLFARFGLKDDYFLVVVAVVIGAATGFGAHLFYALIEAASSVAYGGHHGGGWYRGMWYMLIVLPMIGGAVTGFITYRFAREAKGHGVPEVMDAIYRQGGRVRPRVAVAKAVASAMTIGSGGSAGTEGPIVQIGAAIGSGFAQWLGIDRRQVGTMLACGVAGGIAAIFNAPIAGVLFALEIFLRDFSLRTFSPVVFASVISCSVTHALRQEGDVAIFELGRATEYVFTGAELPFYLILGVVCALMAALFIRTLYATEAIADAVAAPEYVKPAAGACLLGVVGAGFVVLSGDQGHSMPPFFGNGYPLIQQAIDPRSILSLSAGMLVLLCLVKTLATCLTLGTGGSGGVFAPSLFIGATVGGAFGLVLNALGLIDDSSVSAYALVGMAAVVAGTTHAPLTAIVILYEITRQPRVILPIMFAAIIAISFSQRLCRDSIYTLKLRRRGVRVGTLADLTILKRITADQVLYGRAVCVQPDEPLQRLLDLAVENETGDFVVVDEQGEFQGLVVAEDIRTALLQSEAVPLLVVGELLRAGVPQVRPEDTLDDVLDAFARANVSSLPVVDPADTTNVLGLITRHAVMSRYQQELNLLAG